MFILPEPVVSRPTFLGIFYGGQETPTVVSSMKKKSCVERYVEKRKPRSQITFVDSPAFSVRLSMWGQELYPSLYVSSFFSALILMFFIFVFYFIVVIIF